jgi:DNA-binding LacI/PurR family transcriptional regulator
VFGHFINGVSAVNIDYRAAGRTATEHLIRHGHRRITMLTHAHFDEARDGTTGRSFDAWERYLGYDDGMRAAGLKPTVVTHRLRKELDVSQEFVAGGAAALGRLRELGPFPTAVICHLNPGTALQPKMGTMISLH